MNRSFSSSADPARRALWEARQRYRGPAAGIPGSPPPPTSTSLRQPARRRRGRWRALKWLVLLLVLVGAAGSGIFGYKILAAGNKISVAERSILGQLKDLLFSSNQYLQGEQEDRINVLLLAIGGEGHSGENLADTIMLVSLRPSDGSAALLSIPRDLYVQVPGEEYYSKINSVHAYGEAKKKEGGPALVQQKVEEITGLTIHYHGRVDFAAFKSIVDAVGGIDVRIENSFFDYWHKISFPAGTEKMNGERALAYVRARYIEGPEGGDFRRARRQQQILLALRDKVFSVQTAFDFGTMNSILDSLSDNIRTNMQLWEMKRMFELARTIKHENVASVVLTTGPNGMLVGTTEVLGGVPAAVLRPRTGDYNEIHQLAANIFAVERQSEIPTAPAEPAPSPSPTPTAEVVKPKIEIRNGTNITGLAKQTADSLTAKGYEIAGIGNAANRATAKTTVYALNNENEEAAKAIAKLLSAQADSGLPAGEAKSQAQVLVVLGTDARQ